MPVPTPFLAPTFVALTFLPQDLFGGPGIASPIVSFFEHDLLSYLSGMGIVVYVGHVPQGAGLPACTFQCVSEDPRYSLRSASGLTARNYQFASFSTVADDTFAIEKSIRAALHGFKGLMGSTRVSSCRLQNILDQFEVNVDGSDDGTYQRMAEYKVFFTEAVPSF